MRIYVSRSFGDFAPIESLDELLHEVVVFTGSADDDTLEQRSFGTFYLDKLDDEQFNWFVDSILKFIGGDKQEVTKKLKQQIDFALVKCALSKPKTFSL